MQWHAVHALANSSDTRMALWALTAFGRAEDDQEHFYAYRLEGRLAGRQYLLYVQATETLLDQRFASLTFCMSAGTWSSQTLQAKLGR